MIKTIFFVGVHNKQNMSPLDSRSLSGKRIDMIINKVGQRVGQFSIQCRKTNLFDCEYLPTVQTEINNHAQNWYERTGICETNPIIILLGKNVSKHFDKRRFDIIEACHPSKVMSSENLDRYIEDLCLKISQRILDLSEYVY